MLRLRGPKLSAIAVLLTATALPALAGEGSGTNNPDLYGLDLRRSISPTPPREGMDPFYDLDWGVGLRGAYTVDSGGGEYSGDRSPEFTLTHEGSRRTLVTGDSEIIVNEAGEASDSSLHLGADGGYALDESTGIAGSARLADPGRRRRSVASGQHAVRPTGLHGRRLRLGEP